MSAKRNFISIAVLGKDVRLDTDKTSATFGGLEGAVRAVASAFLLWKSINLAKDSAYLAARVETLGIVLEVVGRNAGYSRDQMAGFAQGVAAMGITTEESRQTIIRRAACDNTRARY